jgi:uncharacterized protein YecE (DUF72 family)
VSHSQRSPRFRVGTASWTDPTLLASGFYPPSATSAEARLRFYAEHFDTVEVDSTFYALPSERNAFLWASRTPPDFLFHVKAFAALTRHAVEVARLPRVLREELRTREPEAERVEIPPGELLDACFTFFRGALEPLREAGKLGCILFQFPPWFIASPSHEEYIEACAERLPEDRLAIEFRHASWFASDERRERTLRFLKERALVLVVIDAPQAPSLPRTPYVATAEIAYVRLHGRNRRAWFAKHERASERFQYLYSDAELAEIATRVRSIERAREVEVIFNNCYADYGVRNAATLRDLLARGS